MGKNNHQNTLRYNVFIIVSLKYEHTLFIKKIHMNQQSYDTGSHLARCPPQLVNSPIEGSPVNL